MKIHYISDRSVSIRCDEINSTNWLVYDNSYAGRTALVAEQPPEIVAEVMAVWGDTPTVPDLQPELLTPEQQTSTELSALKAKLTASDYQAIKYAEGWMSVDEYAPIREQRQAWRDEINRLEQSL